MKFVIDIPEELACEGFERPFTEDEKNILIKAIGNGTPLPKGYGRLIDADALKMDTRVCGDRYLSKTSLFVANKVIEQAPTIVEEDRVESVDEE